MRCELSVSMLEVYNEKISFGSLLILILWRQNNFVLAPKKELFWACFWIRRFYTFCYEGILLAHALLTSFGRLKEGLLVSLGKISEYLVASGREKNEIVHCVFVSSGGSWSKRKIKCCLVLLFLAYLQQLVLLLWGLILALFLALHLQQFGRFWSSTIGEVFALVLL